MAASVERGSEHPLGEAIVRRAREEGLSLSTIENFQLSGQGVRAESEGLEILIGNKRLMESQVLDLRPLLQTAESLADQGKT